LQSQLPALAAHGIVPFALSYDAVATLETFAAAHGITYPLLSDEGSAFIRTLGILNESVLPTDDHHGIPYPGVYFIAADGRVEDKVFHATHRTRDAAATILREYFGLAEVGDGPHDRQATDTLVAVAALDSATFVRGERVGLRVTIALAPGVHTYGKPLPDGYIPTTLTVHGPDTIAVEPVVYPPTRPFRADWLDEELPSCTGQVTLTTAIVFTAQSEDITLTATLRFQACTTEECFIPEQLSFTLPLQFHAFPS
jgi:hypothetical protein